LFKPEEIDPKFERLSKRLLEKNNLRVIDGLTIKEILRDYGDKFFNIVDETYRDLYGTVPFIEAQRKDIIKAFKLILSPKYIRLIADENDELVAFGLCFPAMGEALQKSKGKLTIPAIFKLLKAIKNPKGLDLGLVGVVDRMKNSGVAIVIFYELMKMMQVYNIEYCETNLNLEDNQEIQNNWNRFQNKLHKRRRSFVMDI